MWHLTVAEGTRNIHMPAIVNDRNEIQLFILFPVCLFFLVTYAVIHSFITHSQSLKMFIFLTISFCLRRTKLNWRISKITIRNEGKNNDFASLFKYRDYLHWFFITKRSSARKTMVPFIPSNMYSFVGKWRYVKKNWRISTVFVTMCNVITCNVRMWVSYL